MMKKQYTIQPQKKKNNCDNGKNTIVRKGVLIPYDHHPIHDPVHRITLANLYPIVYSY